MKNIAILGSTGSIGRQTLQVCDLQQHFCVTALAAHSNIELLAQQIHKYKPAIAAVMVPEKASQLRTMVADTNTKIVSGIEGFTQAATLDSIDIVVTAVVGVIGLIPTIEAIKAHKTIALANKETLVAGGDLVMPLAKKEKVNILPVDSEHSAIFQCLQGKRQDIKKILLTASGGPFFGKTADQLDVITPQDALRHPNWSMGPKITIDSATMMNKGLEFIEAMHLFGTNNIEIYVHRQSIVHSMVEFMDNSVIAQLSSPDMQLPISYALNYPDRISCGTPQLDLFKIRDLTFEKPDMDTFGCLPLALHAGKQGGLLPAVMNAANEAAVESYLDHRIGFHDIARLIEAAMTAYTNKSIDTLQDILDADLWARDLVRSRIS